MQLRDKLSRLPAGQTATFAAQQGANPSIRGLRRLDRSIYGQSSQQAGIFNLLAATGGTAAALSAGSALNLLPSSASAASLILNLGSKQRKVAILGGVFQGLLRPMNWQAGYECTVLKPPPLWRPRSDPPSWRFDR